MTLSQESLLSTMQMLHVWDSHHGIAGGAPAVKG
jgi:hypothetical protein